MNSFTQEAQSIMNERFGCDRLISIGTTLDNIPYVRAVNAVYHEGCFYVITHAQSSKMKQIEQNPIVAVCGEWFTGHGIAENRGYVLTEQNKEFYQTLRVSFESWIDNGHVDDSDMNTIILCIHMKTGVLYSNGTRYDIDFTNIELS